MILRADHRTDHRPIGKGEKGRLLPLHKFLNDDACPRITKGVILHDGIDGIECLLLRHGDDNALARRKPIRLDDDGSALLTDVGACGLCRGKDLIACRRDSVLFHDILGEGLRALDLRRIRARSKGADPCRLKLIYQPVHQRHLRADDDQPDLVLLDKTQNCRMIVKCNRRRRTHPGISGDGVNLLRLRAFREFPIQGVLAPARADDKNIHVVFLIFLSVARDMRRWHCHTLPYEQTPPVPDASASCRPPHRPFRSSQRFLHSATDS